MPPFVPLLVGLALVAAVFDAGVLATLVYFLAGVALFVRWWLDRVPRAVTYRRVYETHLFFDERATVTLELRNEGAFPIPWLQYSERLPLRLGYPRPHVGVAYVPAHAVRRLEYTVRGTRRGLYTLGPLTLHYGDIFGFQDRTIRGDSTDRVVVYPKIVPLEHLLLPSQTPLGTLRSRNPLSEDPSRVIGVREYQRGDSMRRIHWPATARTGTLQVKKLEPAMTLQATVLLDLHPARYDPQLVEHYQELAIVAAASFASRLIDMRQSVGLVSNGADPLGGGAAGVASPDAPGDGWGAGHPGPAHATPAPVVVPPGRGRGHLMRLLELLARVEGSQRLPFEALLRRETHGLGWGSTVVVITGGDTNGLTPALAALRRGGYTVVMVNVGGRRWTRSEDGSVAGLQLRTYRVREEAELPVIAEALRG